MNTRIFKMDPQNIDDEVILFCADILKNGGTVAFPTETVYGLGANALDKDAVAKIFKAKGRPADNPLILHVTSIRDVEKYAVSIPPAARKLAKIFWPGPLSIILEKKNLIPAITTGGLNTVAFRVPSNKIAFDLILKSELPLAAPSANLSGKPSTTDGSHVIDDLNGKIAAIIDAGRCEIGLESTVVDFTSSPPCVLRPGGISFKELEMIIPDIQRSYENNPLNTPKSPGMKYRHYSPRASLIIVKGSPKKTRDKINELTEQNSSAGVLCSSENTGGYLSKNIICAGSRKNPEEIASNIFNALRMFDKLDIEVIYSEYFDIGPMEDAVMNRLQKAAREIIETD